MDGERSLVAAAKAGDQRALEELLRAHQRGIYALCRRFAANEADAQDMAQEAVIAIIRGLPAFEGRSSFKTWAFRLTTNTCLMELRSRSRRPPLASEEAQLRDRTDGGSAPHDVAAVRLDTDAAFAALSPEHRAAVVLRDVLGLEYGEIAEVLEVPIGTVRSRIARGRAAVADLLRDEEPAGTGNRSGLDGIQGET
jgi:RNA polymerase sigma-70 factor (ECF subfamily)